LKKKTIKNEIVFEGVGLHTGERSKIRIIPYDGGQIVFKKRKSEIPAHFSMVVETRRGVVLSNGSFTVYTVEHLLSALWGMEIDSVMILMDEGEEVPALDGSSLEFAQAIYSTGYVTLNDEIEFAGCRGVSYKDNGKEVQLVSSLEFKVTYFVDFPPPIGTQVFLAPLYDAGFYLENIAPARTFIFDFEVAKVKAMGLAKGGNLENTVVFTKDGVYNGNLRFKDEPVRHKILDFIGDMALLGRRIKGSVFVKKAGHTEHMEFIKKMEECDGV